jgi:serine/threonine protein kinase
MSTPDAAGLGQLGEYQLLEKLGEGGMGTVYKAIHTELDRVVALKVLRKGREDDDEAIARFRREMKAVGQVDHPNLVRAHDAREIEGTRVLVTEYVDGLDLDELVEALGPLPIADACELVRQAAVGLQHAHEHGLVHRAMSSRRTSCSVETVRSRSSTWDLPGFTPPGR